MYTLPLLPGFRHFVPCSAAVAARPAVADASLTSFERDPLEPIPDLLPAKTVCGAPQLVPFQQQIERIQRLPRAQQRFVLQMLETVLAQRGR